MRWKEPSSKSFGLFKLKFNVLWIYIASNGSADDSCKIFYKIYVIETNPKQPLSSILREVLDSHKDFKRRSKKRDENLMKEWNFIPSTRARSLETFMERIIHELWNLLLMIKIAI